MMPQSRILHSSTDTKTACARAQGCFDWSNYTIRQLAGQMITRLDQTMESGDNMFIFSELTYDRVGGYLGHGDPFTLYRSIYGSYRGVPRGLDVLAVFWLYAGGAHPERRRRHRVRRLCRKVLCPARRVRSRRAGPRFIPSMAARLACVAVRRARERTSLHAERSLGTQMVEHC